MNTSKNYGKKLDELKRACDNAQKEVVICETRLQSLKEEKERLMEECKQKTGYNYEELAEILEKKEEEFNNIMSKIEEIDFSNIDDISDEDIKKLEELHELITNDEEESDDETF